MESGLDGTGRYAELDGGLRMCESLPVKSEYSFPLALGEELDGLTNPLGHLGRFDLFLGTKSTIEQDVGKRDGQRDPAQPLATNVECYARIPSGELLG